MTGASRYRRGEDPLAELGRLIGQEDPFAEFSASETTRPRRAISPRYERPYPATRPIRTDRASNYSHRPQYSTKRAIAPSDEEQKFWSELNRELNSALVRIPGRDISAKTATAPQNDNLIAGLLLIALKRSWTQAELMRSFVDFQQKILDSQKDDSRKQNLVIFMTGMAIGIALVPLFFFLPLFR
jgi:hypothetical protein